MADLFSLLRGSWHFRRRLLHANGDVFEACGRAIWERSGHAELSLGYEETGRMSRVSAPPTPPVDVKQFYTWSLTAPLTAEVSFSDGRPFHSLSLPALTPGSRSTFHHTCPPDEYSGAFSLTSPLPEEGAGLALEVEWRVLGPKKAYTSLTRYWRGADGPASEG